MINAKEYYGIMRRSLVCGNFDCPNYDAKFKNNCKCFNDLRIEGCTKDDDCIGKISQTKSVLLDEAAKPQYEIEKTKAIEKLLKFERMEIKYQHEKHKISANRCKSVSKSVKTNNSKNTHKNTSRFTRLTWACFRNWGDSFDISTPFPRREY